MEFGKYFNSNRVEFHCGITYRLKDTELFPRKIDFALQKIDRHIDGHT